MTKKPYLAATDAMTGLFCLTLAVLALLPPSNHACVSKTNFDRVEKGMTLAEVEAIFGEPATFSWTIGCFDPQVSYSWRCEDGAVARVTFFHEVVSDKTWRDSGETASGKMRRWLKRLRFRGK